MLESVEGAVICGVIQENEYWCDIYCDRFGALAYDNYSDGAWCISEVNIPKTVSFNTSRPIVEAIESGQFGNCIGVIYGYDGDIAVLLDHEYAVMRKVWAPREDVGKKFFYSTDMQYEVD